MRSSLCDTAGGRHPYRYASDQRSSRPGDNVHNLSDVSTSALVFVGFRASRRLPTERYPYGYERAEDLAGIGVALVIWGSAVVAGFESVNNCCVTAARVTSAGASPRREWGSRRGDL